LNTNIFGAKKIVFECLWCEDKVASTPTTANYATQRYIFTPKIYLHTKEYYLPLSLVQREDKEKTLWGEDIATEP
jgi:hypothetical protein